MTIDELLSKKSFQVRELLRMNNIRGKGLAGIKEGYDKYGNTFMIKVIDTLKDPSNNFSNYGGLLSTVDMYGEESTQLAPDTQIGTHTTGKGWTFWADLLNAVGNTGETIGAFKQNVLGSVSVNQEPIKTELPSPNSKVIFYLAGAAILIIVVLLVIYNKKK
jgi:hypothetical protein